MKQVEGDLIALAQQGQFDLIIHGCNCMHTFGAGIAKSVRLEFPEAYKADCATGWGDRNKLGTFSQAVISQEGREFLVVNAYTQYDHRGPGPNVDYEAIRKAFRAIKQAFSGLRMGYPQIGAGLAGGDWAVIAAIIDEELAGEDHTVVIFRK